MTIGELIQIDDSSTHSLVEKYRLRKKIIMECVSFPRHWGIKSLTLRRYREQLLELVLGSRKAQQSSTGSEGASMINIPTGLLARLLKICHGSIDKMLCLPVNVAVRMEQQRNYDIAIGHRAIAVPHIEKSKLGAPPTNPDDVDQNEVVEEPIGMGQVMKLLRSSDAR